MSKEIQDILAGLKKGLVCLVPKPNADSVITCHEYTHCDCQVLKLIEALSAAIQSIEVAQQEIHDEHCDEDWHCNWCEASMISLAEINRILNGKS